jgi:hypothetical protein
MDYKIILERERVRISSLLEPGITIKKIDGKSYKYRQVRIGEKIKSEYLGVADAEHIGLRNRLKMIEWLISNQESFFEGIKILQELKGT